MRDRMNGLLGDTAVINGAISPELDVKNEVIRLRLLNGSNARDYKFNFNDNNEFNQIASDGGFLEESVAMKNLSLAPRSEEHTSELQSRGHLVCRLLLEKKETYVGALTY